MSAKALSCLVLAILALSCASPQTSRQPTLQDKLQEELVAVAAQTELQLRYNPAQCDCPSFELKLNKRWLRTNWLDWQNATWAQLRQILSGLNVDKLPPRLRVKGNIVLDSLHQDTRGLFQVDVEVLEVLSPDKDAE
ncbi:MAG TPA: hypothetical protein DCQ06_04355 [Myxococcales bacterium]|nr:hypothetical protein [Myxococcales bacterium]HAN30808.1 hypothetical protein [Myxococcales bacterium]